ncbi:MAG: adenosylhomocysteinase [Candidatus Asgardarchaeia archaeon]
MESIVKDPSLADLGLKKIRWAERWMPVLKKVREDFRREKVLDGMKVAVVLHIEKKTAVLIETLLEGGAEIYAASCNPLSTDDSVAAALSRIEGVRIFAWSGESDDEYYENIKRVLNYKPNIIIDDGGDAICMAHEVEEYRRDVLGACEETTTGVVRIRNLERSGNLLFPVIAVNDARMKRLFDNRYGTGQSVLDGIMRSTNKLICGSRIIVAGYGFVGRGIAKSLRAMGAIVIVTEVDPIKALEAIHDGFIVDNMLDAIVKYKPDMIITATGNRDVISMEHLKVLKDGTILANAGHFNVEISLRDLESYSVSKKKVKECVEEYTLPGGRRVYLLSEGRLINLVRPCGQGHPIEIMDYSFSLQALSVRYLVKNYEKLERRVYEVPYSIDEMVARIKLSSMGIKIDELTDDQRKYLGSWIL